VRARIAWGLALLSVVCAVVDTFVTAQYQPLLSQVTWAQHGWPLATLATVGAAVMGALIISRHPRHPIGWLLEAAGISSVSLALEGYSIWVLDHDGPGATLLGHLAAWLSLLFGGPLAIAAVTLICLIAPDGRLMSPRWRWPARGVVLGLALYVVGIFTTSPTRLDLSETSQGVLPSVFFSSGALLIGVSLVAAAVGLVLRLTRAEGEVRRQLLWVASSAGFIAAGFAFLLTMQAATGAQEQTLLTALPLFAGYLSFSICTAVAVLRHRLFDIDVIVNRALVVIVASGLVAIGYVVLVVGVGSAVGAGGFWSSLLATAVVAAAFQPLRRRVVRVADRLAFGAAAAPYDALADFSRRLGESPDPSMLLAAFADAAGTAVNARSATARLPVPGGRDRVETWAAGPVTVSQAAGTVVQFPVVEAGEVLGALAVEMPGGRSLRPRDAKLLRDLADQAAIGFRNARLSAEILLRVEQLDRQTVELAESRTRLITAADAERSRLERAIAQDVLSQLSTMPAQLEALAGAAAGPLDPVSFEPLVAASTSALDALREITRGVFPAQLERFGLESALGSLLTRTGTGELVVDASAVGVRFDPMVEAAAYFCVAEASRDLGGGMRVALAVADGALRVVLEGGRSGRLDVAGFRDRVEAVGGTIREMSGDRTLLEISLPERSAVGASA
jgi:signal transduction histidine kinase